jgi:hypothetical protein
MLHAQRRRGRRFTHRKMTMQFRDKAALPEDVLATMKTRTVNHSAYLHYRFSDDGARDFFCKNTTATRLFSDWHILVVTSGAYVDADEESREMLDNLFGAHPGKIFSFALHLKPSALVMA